ncbi:MAG: T9SS type A sorting domain-containing protein, partial [Bacteroidales bacterium]|nr:T9SS type A sorting domain-containing protein [Bacteroidales bacterium]
MKKLVLTGISCFAFVIVLAQAGNRFPVTAESTWRVDSVDALWRIIENTKYYIRDDTFINTRNYFKIYKSGVAFYDLPFYYNNIYVGAIREEDNKVYYIKKSRRTESWLYDFNLEVGDTIKSDIAQGNTIKLIDTLPGGRKILYYDLGHYTEAFLIEGIGTNGGLLSGGTGYIPLHSGECSTFLICYAENGELVYQCPPHFESNCDIVNPDHQYTIQSSAKWLINKEIDSDTLIDYARYQYYILGDTVINSIPYYKFYKKGKELIQIDPGIYSCKIDENKYMGAIRDQDNKFYFVKEGSPDEDLLYDFTLQKGEINTAKIYKNEMVYDVGTMIDNRRIIYFGDDYWSKKIVAGIGSVKDFLDEKEMSTHLQCYSENNVPIYHYSGTYDCGLTLSDVTFPVCNTIQVLPNYIEETTDKKLRIKLCYPVPAENGTIPEFAGYNVSKNGYQYKIDLYYNDANQIMPGQQILMNLVEDTIPIGILEQGYYEIECSVHAIYDEKPYDTTFNIIQFDFGYHIWVNPNYVITRTDNLNIKIYPVPVKNRLYIELIRPDPKIMSVEIYNVLGTRVVSMKTENMNSVEIDVTNLNRGVYILRLNELSTFSTHKIIV